MSTRLDVEQQDWLLHLVDNPHSDYDEGAEGWVNYTVTDDHLVVTHEDEDHEVVEGRWHLTFVGGSVKQKGEADA